MKKEFSLEWKKITKAWEKSLPPARPSKEDIGIYRDAIVKELKTKKKLNILILGSTPELRDLVSEFYNKTNLVCCDINLEMFLAMTPLVKKVHPNEMFFRSDWINAPLKDTYFDVIIGDGVITNIPKNLYNDFFNNLKRILRSDGVFVTRNPFHPKSKYKSTDEVLKIFEEQGKTLSPEVELYIALCNSTTDTKSGICSMVKCNQVLSKYFNKKNKKYTHPSKYISSLLNGKFLFDLLMSNKKWTYYSENKIEKIISNFFIIEKKVFNSKLDRCAMNKMFGASFSIYTLRNKI